MEFDDNLNPVPPDSNPNPTPPKPPAWVPPQSFSPQPGPARNRPIWWQPTPLIGAAVILVLVAAWLFQQAGDKPTDPSTGQPQGLNVSAEGIVYATPDIAKLFFGVQQTGKEASAVEDQLSERINTIKAKLVELGVEDKDIKTSDFSIYPDYGPYPIPTTNPQIRSYTGRHILEVTVRDLDRVNDVADGAIAAGANEVQNISFTVEDPESYLQEARTQAIQKAKDKAKQLAEAADIRLGRLLSINEYPVSMPFDGRFGYGGMGGAEDTKIGLEPGNMEVRVNVTLVYAIR